MDKPSWLMLYLKSFQWLVTHLRRDQYKIQNLEFNSFASYNPRPEVEDLILGKPFPKVWKIRLVASTNVYQ